MHRRAFLSALSGGFFAAPLAAEAQQAGKLYSIRVLTSAAGPSPTYAPIVRSALRC
jgi:hypothetical protein